MVGLGGDRNFESVQDLDHFQQKTVRDKKREALKAAQTSVKNAYELVLSLEKDGSIQAKKITLGAQSSLPRLCRKGRSGYSTTKIDAEAIMPNGLYPVWSNLNAIHGCRNS